MIEVLQRKLLSRIRSSKEPAIEPVVSSGGGSLTQLFSEPLSSNYLSNSAPASGLASLGTVNGNTYAHRRPIAPPPSDQEETIVPLTRYDIVFLQDLSGSFDDDLPYLVGFFDLLLSDEGKDALQNPDLQVGLGSFVDQPLFPFGSPAFEDYAYRKDQDITDDFDALKAQVASWTIRSGQDTPESQIYAVLQAVSDFTYRTEVPTVIVVVTDAIFHYNEPGAPEYGTPGNDFYPTRGEVAEALKAEGLLLGVLATPGVLGIYDTFITDYKIDGATQAISSDSQGMFDDFVVLWERLRRYMILED